MLCKCGRSPRFKRQHRTARSGCQRGEWMSSAPPPSLFPLDFKEALAAFLKVKPKPKEEMDKAIKQNEKAKKKSGLTAGLLLAKSLRIAR